MLLITAPVLTAMSGDLLAWRGDTQVKLDGLVWGEAHKLVPVAFGVKKLVLSCVVEDDKVGRRKEEVNV